MRHRQSRQGTGAKVAYFLLPLLCLMPTTVQSFCPFKCVCDDQHLSANCTQVPSISIVPMTFNPLLRHLILNQLPMYELSNSLSFYRQLEYLDLRSNQIRQITYQNFNFKPASTAVLPNQRHIDLIQGTAHGLNTSQEILEHNAQVAKNLKQAIYKSLDQSNAASSGMGDNEDEIKFHLRVLDLSDNRIEEIGSPAEGSLVGDVSIQPNRQDFHRIKSVELEKTSPFLTLTKLERLGLGGNRLTHLHKHIFLGLVHLTYLDLSRNNIEHIDPHAFVSLIELRVLDLSQNRLARQLSHLSIALCRAPMNELQDLNLSGNLKGASGSVEVILPNQMFTCAPKLIKLNLNALNMQYIQVYAFDNLHSLDRLNLSQNFLEQVPSDALRNIGTTLKHLDLSDNLIEFINANVFNSLQALERLYMNSMPRLVSFDLASLNTNSRTFLRFIKDHPDEVNNNGYNFQSALKSFLPEHLFMTQPPPVQPMNTDYRPEYQPSNDNLIELQLMNNSRLVSLHSSLTAGLDRPSSKIRFARWEDLKLSGATELHELPLAEMVDLIRLSKELRVDLSYAAHLNCSSCQMSWLIRAARQRLIELSTANQQQNFSPLVRDWNLVLFDKHNPYASQQLGEKVKLTSDTTGCFAPFNVPLMEFARVVETSLNRCDNQATPVSTGKQNLAAPAMTTEKLPSASNNFPAHMIVDQNEPPRFGGSPFDEETIRLLHQHHRPQHKEDAKDSEPNYSLLSLMVVLVVVFAGIGAKLVFTFLVRRRYGLKWRSPSSVTTSIDSPSSFQHNNFNQNLDRCSNPDGFYYNSASYVQKHVPQLQSATTQRLDRIGGEAVLNNIAFRTNVGSMERTHKRNDLFSRIAAFWHRREEDSQSSSLASTKEMPPAINGFLSRHWNAGASQFPANNFSPANVGPSCNEFRCNDETSSVQHPNIYYLAPNDVAGGGPGGTKIVEVSVGQDGHKVLVPLRQSQHCDSGGGGSNKYRKEGTPEVEQIYGSQRQQDIAFRVCNRGDNNPMSCDRIGAPLAPNQVSTQVVVVGETNEVNYEDFIYANSQHSLGAAPVNSSQTRKNQPIGKSSIREHDEQYNKQVQDSNRLELHQQQLEAMARESAMAEPHLRGAGSSACQSYSSMTETTATLQHHHLDSEHQQQQRAARPSNSLKSQNDVQTTDEEDKRRAGQHAGLVGVGQSPANGANNDYDNCHGTKQNGSRPNANDRSALRHQYGDENSQVGRSSREFMPAKSTACVAKQQQPPVKPYTMTGEREPATAAYGGGMFADDGHIYVTLDNRPIEQRQQLPGLKEQQRSRRDEVDDYELLCAERGERGAATAGDHHGSLEPSGGRLRQASNADRYNRLSDHLASDTAQSYLRRSAQRDHPSASEMHKLGRLASVENNPASADSSDAGLGLSSAMGVHERRVDSSVEADHRYHRDPADILLEDISDSSNCRSSVDGSNVIRQHDRVPMIDTAIGRTSNQLDPSGSRGSRKSLPEGAIDVKLQSGRKKDLQHEAEAKRASGGGCGQQLAQAYNLARVTCDKTGPGDGEQVADRPNSDCVPTTNGTAVSGLASRYDANHAYRGDRQQQQPEAVRRPPLPPPGVPERRIANSAGGNSGAGGDDDYVINGLHDQNKRSKSRRLRQQQQERRQQMDPITDRARQRHTFSDMGGTDATTATTIGSPTGTGKIGVGGSVTAGNQHNNDSVGAPLSYSGGAGDRQSHRRNDDNANDFADRQDSILIGQQQGAFAMGQPSILTNSRLTRAESARESEIQQGPTVRPALAHGSSAAATAEDNSIAVERQMQEGGGFVIAEHSKPARDNQEQNYCDDQRQQQQQQQQRQLQELLQTARNNHTNTLGIRRLPNHSQLTTNSSGTNEIYSNQFYYCKPTMAKSETLNRRRQPPSSHQSNWRD